MDPAVFSKGQMVTRQAFLKRLGRDEGFQTENPSKASQGMRSQFLASLSETAMGSTGSCPSRKDVSFSLSGLLEFKGVHQTTSSYKKIPEPARVRSNYDNSRRKLYANPEVRKRQLSCHEHVSSRLSCFPFAFQV